MKLNYRPSSSQILGIITSITALIWLAQIYDIQDLLDPISTANYWYLLIAVLIAIADYVLRTIRWRVLFVENKPKKFSNVFRAMMQGYLFNTLLPARAGELVRVHRLGTDEKISRSTVLGTVVVERVGDMIALILLMGAVFFLYPDLPNWLKYSGLMIVSVTAIAIAILASLHFHGHRLKPFFLSLMNRFLPEHFLSRLESSGKVFLEGLAGLFKMKNISSFMVYTALLWVLEVLIAYYVSGSFGLWIPLGNLLFVMLVITLGTIVPSSPGYIGVYELFGIAGLKLVGVSGAAALSFIVMLHAMAILVPSVIGSLCLIKWQWKFSVFSRQRIDKK
jgi:glycosyltransferase 2 family protein